MNEEFPLLKDIIEKSERNFSQKIKMCLAKSTNVSYDLYFSDAADDATDFVDFVPDEKEILAVIEGLVNCFSSQGYGRARDYFIRLKIQTYMERLLQKS